MKPLLNGKIYNYQVDELMKLCDELESKITLSKEQSAILVDAILSEAIS
jgi:hypothetical protein